MRKNYYFCTRNPVMERFLNLGEVVEWSITAVLKTAVPRGTGGSNPSLSARETDYLSGSHFFDCLIFYLVCFPFLLYKVFIFVSMKLLSGHCCGLTG